MEQHGFGGELKPRRGFEALNLAHTVLAGLIMLNTAFLLYRNDCPRHRCLAAAGFFFALGWLAYLLVTAVVEFANPAAQRMVASAGYLYLCGQVGLGGWAAVARCRARNACAPHWALWLDVSVAFGAFTAVALGAHLVMGFLRRFNKRRFALSHPEGVRVDHPEDYGLAGAESYLAPY